MKSKSQFATQSHLSKFRVDVPTGYRVSGNIRSKTSGTGLADVRVRAYDLKLRSRVLLGETWTDKQGQYRLSYGLQVGKGHPDLQVQATSTNGEIMAESTVRFNANPHETIDLTAGAF